MKSRDLKCPQPGRPRSLQWSRLAYWRVSSCIFCSCTWNKDSPSLCHAVEWEGLPFSFDIERSNRRISKYIIAIAGWKTEAHNNWRRRKEVEEEDCSQCSWQCHSEACQEKEDYYRAGVIIRFSKSYTVLVLILSGLYHSKFCTQRCNQNWLEMHSWKCTQQVALMKKPFAVRFESEKYERACRSSSSAFELQSLWHVTTLSKLPYSSVVLIYRTNSTRFCIV